MARASYPWFLGNCKARRRLFGVRITRAALAFKIIIINTIMHQLQVQSKFYSSTGPTTKCNDI